MPEVTQEDREAAWPFRPSCYRDIPLTRAKWEAGVYDDAAPCIKAFARHREASVAAAVAERDAQIAGLEAKCEALAGALGRIASTDLMELAGTHKHTFYVPETGNEYSYDVPVFKRSSFQNAQAFQEIARAALAQHKGDA
jgi:hypothetical protein